MSSGVWFNNDGLRVKFGNRVPEDKIPAVPNTMGLTKWHELDLTFSSLNDDDIGTPGETQVAGSSDRSEVFPIPSGAIIRGVYLRTGTAWATGTGFEAGLEQLDGTEIDNDGLFDEAAAGAVANLVANRTVLGEATLIDSVLLFNAYVRARWIGTDATTGTLTLVIEYDINPLVQIDTV